MTFNKISLIAVLAFSVVLSSCKKDTESTTPSNNGTNTGGSVSLLASAQTGTPFSTGAISDFTLASNSTNVALIITNNTTGKIYAIELDDNKATDAASNAISAPATNFASQMIAKLGTTGAQFSLKNIEVNPISKAIYVLATNTQNSTSAIFKVTNGGNTVEQVLLDNVKYSEVTYSTSGHRINDVTWGDNTLYVSFNQAATLNGEVAFVKAPFTNGTSVTSRATTVFKSNWGNTFNTDAPLETMTYGEVAGKKRLMGITVCAPGYSFETSDISNGTGLLEVKEYFNLNTLPALKVFTVNNGGKTYLVEFHANGRITRVGEKYIDGSAAENANAKILLSTSGARMAGLTDEDVKVITPAGTYIMIGKYTDSKILVVDRTGALSTLDI